MSARPRIIGVNSLPAAPGLRAMPSSAVEAVRPWPSAPPNAASAMPRPAAMAIHLSRSLNAEAVSSANAVDATNSVASPDMSAASLFEVRAIMVIPPLVLFVGHCALDVDHRQQ